MPPVLLALVFSGLVHAQSPLAGVTTWDARSLEAMRIIQLYKPRNELCKAATDTATRLNAEGNERGARIDVAANLYCDTLTQAFSTRMTIARSQNNALIRDDDIVKAKIADLEKQIVRMDRRIRRAARSPGWTSPVLVGRLQERSARVQGDIFATQDQIQALKAAGDMLE